MALLKTTNLTRQFGGLAALSDVSMEINEKEVVGVIGPNGAGKSTFTNVIAGLYLPTSGKIEFKGRDISMTLAHERCHLGIARTFQLMRPLHGLNMLENIMMGGLFGKGHSLKVARNNAMEICQFMALEKVERPISAMTALEIKKMEIARALATEPSLLFLDEVMAGLNKDETMEMIETVRKINGQGMTIIIIEHVMRVIRELTHRVIVLEWGKVLCEGLYEDVSADQRVITAYLGEESEC
ncbi:MAG TPA: ABC transporter ATP-binding protein [Smithellaceae bacterium]|nr:ABC transporter ATP-binding protein [Smithellaceae bacterium]